MLVADRLADRGGIPLQTANVAKDLTFRSCFTIKHGKTYYKHPFWEYQGKTAVMSHGILQHLRSDAKHVL